MKVEPKFDSFNGTNFQLWKFNIVSLFRQRNIYEVVEVVQDISKLDVSAHI